MSEVEKVLLADALYWYHRATGRLDETDLKTAILEYCETAGIDIDDNDIDDVFYRLEEKI